MLYRYAAARAGRPSSGSPGAAAAERPARAKVIAELAAGLATGQTPVDWGAPLTEREREVCALVRRGWTNREIGRWLHISEHTVKNHLTNIFRKLGVSDRRHLIRLGTEPS
ncbi:MAG: helix-turn-helix transcriptional regulator [Alicyclobacillus sp.]|nr:helix-turn-helix transcriptional regulator [Alicyclobacillus sp.]